MIMELADETPHAYVPFLPAVKSSQPHGNVCFGLQSYEKWANDARHYTLIFLNRAYSPVYFAYFDAYLPLHI